MESKRLKKGISYPSYKGFPATIYIGGSIEEATKSSIIFKDNIEQEDIDKMKEFYIEQLKERK